MFQISSLGLVLVLACLKLARCEDDTSEEKSGVPIIRQINKVNDDGTYTYGYEAADGSFKIETRDVLGNVKGMFGFIDESGDLKRVSYTANNETGFRNSIVHAPTSTPYSTARPHPPEPPGRRPVLILKNTPQLHAPTKGPVIQHIPKKSQKDDEEGNGSTTAPSEEYGGVNGRRFPNASNGSKNTSEERTEDSPKAQGLNPLRKVLVSKRPVEDKDIKGKGGNSLRRQLNRGLDLRGETTHIYAGGDSRYSPNLPPHLSALMSELRPIQVVRTASPESIGYQTVDVEAVPQELNEVSTTTEIPYGARKYVQPSAPPGYISPRYRPRPVPIPEEAQYLHEVTPHYKQSPNLPPPGLPNVPQHLPLALNVPFGAQGSPNYQMQPHYYDQAPYMIPPTLRDELMVIIYNYLQLRLGPYGQNPYYQANYGRPPLANPYLINSPLLNPYGSPYPYVNPYLNAPPYYPPYPNPNGAYPVPSQTPYAGPNVQFSPRQEPPRRISPNRLPTRAAAATDDADLLQMLLTSPTRMPISQLKYSPTTERVVTSRVTQPVRNIQIITDTTESRPVTTEAPER